MSANNGVVFITSVDIALLRNLSWETEYFDAALAQYEPMQPTHPNPDHLLKGGDQVFLY